MLPVKYQIYQLSARSVLIYTQYSHSVQLIYFEIFIYPP